MRKFYLTTLIILLLILTGCGKNITLDNIETVNTDYTYAKVSKWGNVKKIDENYVINEAKNFTNKLIAAQNNRSYKKLNLSDESILYSENYKNKVSATFEEDSKFLNEFYSKYNLTTELLGITYNKILIIGGDAFLNVTVVTRLVTCVSNDIANQIGYPLGINDTAKAEYNIKLKYHDNEYLLYDMERINKEGFLKDFKEYAKNIVDSPEIESPQENDTVNIPEKPEVKDETEEIKAFINRLAALQNNRNYQTMIGNEDYILMSDEYIAMLNKDRDDVAVTKKTYEDLKLVTEFVGTNFKSITKSGDSYIVNVEISSRLVSCISEEAAKRIRYTGGIGSIGVMEFNYTVKRINGAWKLTDSKQLR